MNIESLSIGVICGGYSNEREISLKGAEAVNKALIVGGFNSKIIDIKTPKSLKNKETYKNIDFAFIMIHGKGGEDGEVQKVLKKLNILFSGSTDIGLQNSFDKVLAKELWIKKDIKTPKYITNVKSWNDLPNYFKKLSKLVIKPSKEGSSIGVSIVNNNLEAFEEAITHAKKFEGVPMIEEFISGRELTVSILGNLICDPIKITAKQEFYNYEAKYNSKDTSYEFINLEEQKLKNLKESCKKAFETLGCSKWGRVDLIDSEKEFFFIEVNTVPGMTETSLVPKSAKNEGLSFLKLILKIIKDSIEN